MKFWKLASVALALTTFNANAVIINTLNGTDYEWLELTATQGLSRTQVEAMLSDSNNSLFGYEYASRTLVQDLFTSYASWDELGGLHNEPAVVAGVHSLQSDFGITTSYMSKDDSTELTTVSGDSVWYEGYDFTGGFYGSSGECGLSTDTCRSELTTYLDINDTALATLQHFRFGWDSSVINPIIDNVDTSLSTYGSYLVKESITPVPLPASVWLLGSGLIGLIGIAKRKKS